MNVLAKMLEYGEKNVTVIIGSLASTDIPNWLSIAKAMENTGVKMLELNFGCAHYSEGRMTDKPVAKVPDFTNRMVRTIKHEVSVPIIVKETPQLENMAESVNTMRAARADAVTLTNRFQRLVIKVEREEPLIQGFGIVGGP